MSYRPIDFYATVVPPAPMSTPVQPPAEIVRVYTHDVAGKIAVYDVTPPDGNNALSINDAIAWVRHEGFTRAMVRVK